jgi:hypothetical protein
MPEPVPHDQLRVRLYLGGQLADERWLSLADPDDTTWVGLAHVEAAAEADRTGVLWLVEVFDPDLPEEAAYKRFGTDTAGMVHAVPAPPGPLRPESWRIAGRRYPPGSPA